MRLPAQPRAAKQPARRPPRVARQVRPLRGHLGGGRVDGRGHVSPQHAAGHGDQPRDRRRHRGEQLIEQQPVPLARQLAVPTAEERRAVLAVRPRDGDRERHRAAGHVLPPEVAWAHVDAVAEDGRAERGGNQPRRQSEVDGGGGDPRLDIACGTPTPGGQGCPDRGDAVAEHSGRPGQLAGRPPR